MKSRFIFIFGIIALACQPPKKQEATIASPIKIIFDTDIAGDYDDVGAMTLLHQFADKGEIEILATISSNAFEATVPVISVLNTYFGRPEIPIGVTKKEKPNMNCPEKWAEALIAKYPHNIKSNADATEAVALYRKILAEQPDSSVTIVTVGFFTNIADLFDSPPDAFSPLSGPELIAKKVKLLVSMAVSFPEGKDRGREYNVWVDPKASQRVFSSWNTPILLSGFQIGEPIHTGIPLIGDSSLRNSPVREAYEIALTANKNTIGRNSWDQTAVLMACKGLAPWFTSRKINFTIEDDGTNVLAPGEKFDYAEFKQTPMEVQAVIEELMHR